MAGTDRAATLHAESIIVDGLNISVWDEEVFTRLRRGGLTAINATIAVWQNFRETIDEIAVWHRRFERYGHLIMPAHAVDDILRAKQQGKVGIIFGLQNTAPIEDRIEYLSILKALGVRVIQLTYNDRNYVGDGCLERTDAGLSHFGIAVVKEMNRLGLLIDLSHVGSRTTMETIEVSDQPVAFTHANPRALRDHPRNKTDEQLKALVAKGGLVGANIFPPFLPKGSQSSLEDVLDVIDSLVNLVGVDHVAIGTDFTEKQPDEFFRWLLTGKLKGRESMPLELPIINPVGIQSATEFPNLTAGLLKRRYAEGDVKKIMGENWLRFYREVWG